MIITKQKLLEILSEAILKTCKSCGRNLSLKDQFRIKEEIFKKYDREKKYEREKK